MRSVTIDPAPDVFSAAAVEPGLAAPLGGDANQCREAGGARAISAADHGHFDRCVLPSDGNSEPTSEECASPAPSTLSRLPTDPLRGAPFDRLLDFLGSIKLTDPSKNDGRYGDESRDGMQMSRARSRRLAT